MLTIKSIAITSGALLGIAVIVLAARPAYEGTRAGLADENYLKSTECISCHADHHASWSRTFHSRMTQDATPTSVQGDFERHNTFEYLGVKAQMEKRNAEFFMTFKFPDGRSQTARIDRTVGSRRIEQYLTKQQDQYTRLPLAYDLVNQRWMNLNGSFFHPDSDNYFQHATQWDGNCVFCHNVKAQPHLDFNTKAYRTEVNELGIACGACHGPGAVHAQAALSPVARTWWRLQPEQSRQIVNPRKLTAERSLMICGHCHGQRTPEPFERIQTILTSGDPYNAGDNLAQFYRPITQNSTIGNVAFANRFWANGSPRLTAYEYQGILRSNCFIKGEAGKQINCLTCHSMHEGDPAGQITSENRTDKPCLACHQKFSTPTALVAHTQHKQESSGSRCYNCHMPRVVYGVMSFHPTHDITIPQPQLTVSQAVPNACNQCHFDRSVNWSITEAKRLWPSQFGNLQLSSDEQFNIPEGPRALFAGDALTRALAADVLAGNGPVKPDPLWADPFLVEALADNYPIVRFFAANGLDKAPWQVVKPDYLAEANARAQMILQWRELLKQKSGALSQQAEFLANKLKALRRDVDLEVGE
ncbi:MAG TPA: hypothetical protein VKB46_21540 [Pyrinomonadaceae bacterium]|nr:hypothetical protein [Pyrinomonadaceae bacterium]